MVLIDLIVDRGRTLGIIKQLGLETSKVLEDNQNTFKLYDIDGSIINSDTIKAAEEFLTRVLTNLPSNIDIMEDQLQKHELYPLLHDTHIRILHWLLARLEVSNNRTQQISIPGGCGQILHGLAYGKQEDDNPFRIMTKREVTKLDFDRVGSVLVYSGPKDFVEADANF